MINPYNIATINDRLENFANKAWVTPQNVSGIDGFLFDVLKSESVEISNSITDHYLENNESIQDNVVTAPITISLSGLFAEIVFKDTQFRPHIISVYNRLTPITRFFPPLTGAALQAYTAADKVVNKVDDIKRQAETVYSVFAPRLPAGNRVQEALDSLTLLATGKVLCKVTVFGRLYENMVIESVSFTRDVSPDAATVSVSLKQVNLMENMLFRQMTKAEVVANATVPKTTETQGKPRATWLMSTTNHLNFTTAGSGIAR